jgi:hypothetical protein
MKLMACSLIVGKACKFAANPARRQPKQCKFSTPVGAVRLKA